MKNRSAVLVARRGAPRMFGPSFYASKQTIFATRISYILPKASPIKVSILANTIIDARFLSLNGILNYRVCFIKQLHGCRILGYYKKWIMTSG